MTSEVFFRVTIISDDLALNIVPNYSSYNVNIDAFSRKNGIFIKLAVSKFKVA